MPMSLMNANSWLFGDHATGWSNALRPETIKSPCALTTLISMPSDESKGESNLFQEKKAIRSPSGDHIGKKS